MSLLNQTHFTNFILEIPDAGLTKTFKASVRKSNITGIRIPITETPSGTQGLARAMLPGSTVEFDPLIVEVLVDEKLETWTELYSWMLTINNHLTHNSTAWQDGHVPEFISLHVLDNTKEKIVMTIHYYGAWCFDLGEIEFNYTDESDPPITMVAQFAYKYLMVEKDGQIILDRMSIADSALGEGKGPKTGMHPSLR